MASTPDPDIDILNSLSEQLSAILGVIESHQWSLPTPCSDWNLTALVDHVTGGNRFTGYILSGQTADEAMAKVMEGFASGSVDREGAASSVSEQLTAFGRPDVLDQTWSHVAGDLTGRQILRLRLHDLIVHLWDIRETLDPPSSLPPKLAQWGLAELSDPESLTFKHFEITPIPQVSEAEGPVNRYLNGFGRQPQAAT